MINNPIWLTLLFLMVCLWAYAFFGGADFGMGVLEILYPGKKKDIETLSKQTIGPVWEANHVWVIIIIVMLFIAFPSFFASMTISHHIPLFLFLLGIIARGSAFSFRHYDPIEDKSHRLHQLIFNGASLMTPILLGMIIASFLSPFPINQAYLNVYIWPWVTLFTVCSGLTFLSITILTATVLSYFESEHGLHSWLLKVFKNSMITLAILSGITAIIGHDQAGLFAKHSPLITLTLTAWGVCFIVLYVSVTRGYRWISYIANGAMVFSMFFGLLISRFPTIYTRGNTTFTWFTDTSPTLSIWLLNAVLILGLLIVIPLLIYLFFIFKGSSSMRRTPLK